jgi:hypothetical protein
MNLNDNVFICNIFVVRQKMKSNQTKMRIKNWAFCAIFLMGIITSSCNNNDENEEALSDDPRVRSLVINGISKTFVVNDTESIIYNYDSLSYGTNIKSLYPSFYGYDGALSIQYLQQGAWVEYSSSNPLDFSSPLQIKSISADGAFTKEYNVDIRVHKYDVEAITWEKVATLPITSSVISQKTIRYNNSYYLFYADETGESFVLISSDGENWSSQQLQIDNPDWKTLSYMSQGVVVKTANGLYACDLSSGFTFSEVAVPADVTNITPLFTVKNSFLLIGEKSGSYYLYELRDGESEYRQKSLLPQDFPVAEITTYLSPTSSNLLGYVFGGKNADGSGSVWSVDISGNVINLTNNRSSLPFRRYPMPLYFENNLFLVGGEKADGYTDEFLESTNFGVSWFDNTHKTLPKEIGARGAGYIYEYERNMLILIGGVNETGFQPDVWKGTLNQKILDEILNQ